MATIADVLNKYRTKTASGVTAPQEETLETGGAGVTRQNVTTQMQAAQSDRMLRNAAADNVVEGNLLEEQRKQQNLQRDEQLLQLGRQAKTDKRRFEMGADKILTDLENNMNRLSDAEKLDQMEAAATYLRLQDEKYRYELTDVGRRKRLDNAISFKQSMKEAIFKDELDMVQNDIGFKKALDMTDAEFRKWLTTIDVDTALAVANSQAASANRTAMISGVGSAITTGVGYAMKDGGTE
jgi:hypothetical protein